jgi:hypothetical protein
MCNDAFAAQRQEEGQLVRHPGDQALSVGAAPVRAGHIGLYPNLIDKDHTFW